MKRTVILGFELNKYQSFLFSILMTLAVIVAIASICAFIYLLFSSDILKNIFS